MSSTETTPEQDDADQLEQSAGNDSPHEPDHAVAAEAARRQARQDPLQG